MNETCELCNGFGTLWFDEMEIECTGCGGDGTVETDEEDEVIWESAERMVEQHKKSLEKLGDM